MRIIFFLLIFILSSFSSPYSFEDLIRSLETTNPAILSSRLQTLLAKEELKSAKSVFYPRLSLSANTEYSKKYSNTNNHYINDESLVGSTGFANSLSLRLNYEIYKFGASSLNIRGAEQRVRSLSYKECNTLNEAKLRMLELYHKILDYKDKILVYEELKNIHKQVYDLSKRLYEAGDIQKTLLASKAIELVETDDNIIRINKELEYMLGEISNLSGIDIMLSSQILPFKDNLQTSFNAPAFEDTNKARELNALISSKQLIYKSRKKDYFPAIHIYAKYDFYGDDRDSISRSFDDTRRNGYRVGVSLSYNLFDGFSREASIQSAFIETRLAEQELISAKREYEKEMRNLRYEMEQISNKVNTATDLTNSSKSLFEMADKLYDIGESDKITVLEALIRYYENDLLLKETSLEKIVLNLKHNLILERSSLCNPH